MNFKITKVVIKSLELAIVLDLSGEGAFDNFRKDKDSMVTFWSSLANSYQTRLK